MCSSSVMGKARPSDDAPGEIEKPRLVVLDDNPDWGRFISDVAERAGFHTNAARSHREYHELVSAEAPDVLVLDLFMPEKDGIEMIMELERLDNRPFLILISGQSCAFLRSVVKLGRSKGLEVVGALAKPFRVSDLNALLEEAAALIAGKKKLESRIRAENADRKTISFPRKSAIDNEPSVLNVLQIPRPKTGALSMMRDHCRAPDVTSSVKHSIAAINSDFCLMLWTTQLATLQLLEPVPDRLTEAAVSLFAAKTTKDEEKEWRQALRINMGIFADNQAAIREIANTHHLNGVGRSMAQTIYRIESVVSEMLASEDVGSTSDAMSVERLRQQLCSENDCLRESLTTLISAVKVALSRAGRSSGPHLPSRSPTRKAPNGVNVVTRPTAED